MLGSQAGSNKESAKTNRSWAVCMEVYSGRLFVLLNPTDPPQNLVSTTQGSACGLRQALTGGSVHSTDKVTVWHKGPVWVMLKNYINNSHIHTHTKSQVIFGVSPLNACGICLHTHQLKQEDSLMNHSHSFSTKTSQKDLPWQSKAPINLLALLSGPWNALTAAAILD